MVIMSGRSSDDEYEYEETTVIAEIIGVMESEFLANATQAKILGIDGEKPLLQVDDYTFSGQYEDTIGTCLLFQDTSEGPDAEKKLEYSGLSFKKLCLQSVFLKENEKKVAEKDKGESSTVTEVQLNPQYITETIPGPVTMDTNPPSDLPVDLTEHPDKNTEMDTNSSENV